MVIWVRISFRRQDWRFGQHALARSFVAKAVLGLATTAALIAHFADRERRFQAIVSGCFTRS
jgi:hypothetical protein